MRGLADAGSHAQAEPSGSGTRPHPNPLPGGEGTGHALVLLLPVAMIALLAIANLDVPIARFFRDSGLAEPIDRMKFLRWPGYYWFTAVSALFFFLHPQTWRAVGMVMLAGVPAALNFLLKWTAGRSRPFRFAEAYDWHPFRNGFPGLIKQENLSMASGDVTLAFAWATAMTLGVPRLRVLWYGLACVVAFQRVGSTDHYLTDAIVGAVLGVVTVRLLFRILSRIVPPARDGQGTGLTKGHERSSSP